MRLSPARLVPAYPAARFSARRGRLPRLAAVAPRARAGRGVFSHV